MCLRNISAKKILKKYHAKYDIDQNVTARYKKILNINQEDLQYHPQADLSLQHHCPQCPQRNL